MESGFRKTLFFSVFLTLLTMAIVYYSFNIGRNITERHSPLIHAVMKLKLEATTAHLWFEKGMNGDHKIEIKDIWSHLDQSEWYAQAMLNSGIYKNINIIPLQDPNLRKFTEQTLLDIQKLRRIVQDRWTSRSKAQINDELKKDFDLTLRKFTLDANNIENELQNIIDADIQLFKFTQLFIISLILIIGITICRQLQRNNMNQLNNINALKLSEEDVFKSKNQLLNIINAAKLGYWNINHEMGKFTVNDEWLKILGLPLEDGTNYTNSWKNLVHPNDIETLDLAYETLSPTNKTISVEFRMKHTNGEWIWVQSSGAGIKFDKDSQKSLQICGVHQNITKRKNIENEIKLAANVFTFARESIVITDADAIIIKANDTFSQVTGYNSNEAIGLNPNILQSGRHSPEFYAEMWKGLLNEGHWSGEVWNRRKNGEVYAEMKTINAVYDDQGSIIHYISLGNDITPMKEHQKQLEHIAHYDILTNLPNRALLSDRLSQSILQCNRHSQLLAVVFLDLDGFKAVNDTHGHDMGDQLLITLAGHMKEALREGDSLARIGGDEFVAVLTNLTTPDDCKPILKRLLRATSEPTTIGDTVIKVSASIGATVYPHDNVDADQLMRHADQAMYVAKGLGKNRYHLFDTAQDEAVRIHRESLEAIRSALDNDQFVLYYQPKVNMKIGSVIGLEALIRWQHPTRGLLNPIDFLPIIENNPISIEIGEWVIDTVLNQISLWQKNEFNIPLTTSVNIAAVQLQQTDFSDKLAKMLAAHPDVAPHLLELEVLETSALENIKHVSKTMNACSKLGVKFSLDDFGTGYSSLTYLRRLPANVIKIDQSFVRDMLHDTDDLAIVESIIALAKSFKREVIAEGAETTEHGAALLKLGCDLAQGYGIATPMPVSEVQPWVNCWKPDVRWQH